MNNHTATTLVIRGALFLILQAYVNGHHVERDLDKYIKTCFTQDENEEMLEITKNWIGESQARLESISSYATGALLEVFHIGGNLPLPTGELQVYLGEFLARAGGYGIKKEAALAAMACGEIAWCVCPSVTGELVIGFNEAEVTIFVNTIKPTASK